VRHSHIYLMIALSYPNFLYLFVFCRFLYLSFYFCCASLWRDLRGSLNCILNARAALSQKSIKCGCVAQMYLQSGNCIYTYISMYLDPFLCFCGRPTVRFATVSVSHILFLFSYTQFPRRYLIYYRKNVYNRYLVIVLLILDILRFYYDTSYQLDNKNICILLNCRLLICATFSHLLTNQCCPFP